MNRREFKKSVKVEIIKRAGLNHLVPNCENCGSSSRQFEIDHRDPDAMQIDKSRKLTAEDGWLLCIPCHDAKTKIDVAGIAKAKRVEAKHLGAEKPHKQKIAQKPKPDRSMFKTDQIRAMRESRFARDA